MRVHHVAKCIVLIAAASLSASCETTKAVGTNIKTVYNGGQVDKDQLSTAIQNDSLVMESQMQQLKTRMAAALAALRSNVQKRWGQSDTKTADRTTYVKYTQGYKSRVVTDFDKGQLTVETLDQSDPQGSLKTAIIAALLTSNDPGAVDLFSDKDVSIDPNRRPYLYGLVHDELGKSISTHPQAEKFAQYLLAHKLQTRTVTGDQGAQTSRYVIVVMVRNFEDKGAEKYRTTVAKYSAKYNVSPSLVLAIMRTESNFNPFAVSSVPAYGLMQLVPPSGGREAYKRVTGVDQTPSAEYLYDPEHSIELGTALLGELYTSDFKAINKQDSRDLCVIAAYNTGARNVTKTFDKDSKAALVDINGLDSQALYERLRVGLPYPETRQYVVKVTGYRKQLESLATSATALQ